MSWEHNAAHLPERGQKLIGYREVMQEISAEMLFNEGIYSERELSIAQETCKRLLYRITNRLQVKVQVK